jgi:UDP-N-acetylmuramoyl-tripeptide--D-alanyl-D-alanine ligase
MRNIFKKIVIQLLEWEARAILQKYNPKIVAITGTVGKTSTKDAIYTALKPFISVRKSPKSFNSDFGVPLTIIGKGNPASNALGWLEVLSEGLALLFVKHHYPEWLVLEIGTDRPRDIEKITHWLKPDMVVVTKLSKVPVHVEAFETVEAVFKEKGNLVKALKSNGTLILNAEDEDVLAYKSWTKGQVVLYGDAVGSDLRPRHFKTLYEDAKPAGVAFEVIVADDENFPLAITLQGALGEQNMQHVLAALSVADVLHENLHVAAAALSQDEPTQGRMRIVEGINGSTLIDDTYNSSPVALAEALNTLKKVKAKRKIAVLGDMLELGRFSIDEHKKAGERAREVADMLVTVGMRAKYMEAGPERRFNTSREAGFYLKDKLEKGDVVLIKGSQSVRMEWCTEMLMAHPEMKKKFLVRQDKEWQERDAKKSS